MFKNNETIDTLTARHFALEATIAAVLISVGKSASIGKEMERMSEAMRAMLLASQMPEPALAAFEQTLASMKRVL